MIMMCLSLDVLPLVFICRYDCLVWIILLAGHNYSEKHSVVIAGSFQSLFSHKFFSCELGFYIRLTLPESLFKLLAGNFAGVTGGLVKAISKCRMDLLVLRSLIRNLDYEEVQVRKIAITEVKTFLEIFIVRQ